MKRFDRESRKTKEKKTDCALNTWDLSPIDHKECKHRLGANPTLPDKLSMALSVSWLASSAYGGKQIETQTQLQNLENRYIIKREKHKLKYRT